MEIKIMDWIHDIFDDAPLAALFLTVAFGYIIGKLKIGKFILGGIAGTLIMGVIIGQLGIDIPNGIKSMFFALFIYAVGFQGGPQFIQSLNLRSLNLLTSSFLMTVAGLACVLVAAWMFNLDRGSAAGLAAGGLTQSAIIGTAGSAIQALPDASAAQKQIMETNVAVGYAVCYIFGSLGPIIIVSWFIPMIMGWDIRKEAVALAKKMGGGNAALEPGQFDAVRRVNTRFFNVDANCKALGKTTLEVDSDLDFASVEAIIKDGDKTEFTNDTVLKEGDIVAITGRIHALEKSNGYFGKEAEAPDEMQLVEEHRELIVTNSEIAGKSLKDLRDNLSTEKSHGIFITGLKRMGHALPLVAGLQLHKGDEMELTGRPVDLNRAQPHIGYKITAAKVTDFVFFGFGMFIGYLLGMISFSIAGVPMTIGTGVGCLLSGLFFGWLRNVHPHFAALPSGASNFLRDFGLAVFVGVVGISAAPSFVSSIQQYGVKLLLLGACVTIIPQIVVFFISYYVLRVKNPIEALAAVMGGRSANPGFAALLEKAGNNTPVATFTITYAIANIFLTLWGPVIIGVISTNPTG